MDLVLFVELVENEIERRNLNIQRRQLTHSSDPLTIPENTFKGLFRISKELAHWVFHQILPYMRESERTTGIPKNLKIMLYNSTNIL
ncbi:hypothetical protein FQA39_LY06909 [Lamprigera yunnana]|nr:hypothetical protein FQA39_LY06909 [Lamprigera yunnana]